MHRLTNNDADRLAKDLDEAAMRLHQWANQHHAYGAAMEIMGEHRWSEYHEREARLTEGVEHDLRTYATALRERHPLWDNDTRPAHSRARLPKSSRRRAA